MASFIDTKQQRELFTYSTCFNMDIKKTYTSSPFSSVLNMTCYNDSGDVRLLKEYAQYSEKPQSASYDPYTDVPLQASVNSLLIDVLNGAVIPTISVCGVLGNLLNLIILSARYTKREVDVLERGALAVLIALASSDLLFCITTLPYAKYHQVNKAVFYTKDFEYYFKLYGFYFHNAFIKVSTWLTCVVGLARYVGICHPLRARIFIGLCGIRIAIVISYVVWFLLMIPLLFTFSVHDLHVNNVTSMYIIDVGPFSSNVSMRTGFSYVWFILGYFLPITILGFCNIRLICALRQSLQLRKQNASFSDGLRRQRDLSTRITLTLVALILSCMFLVSPSEILYFYSEVMEPESYESFELASTFANVLQATNVSFHFVLYCTVNATFRRTVVSFVGRLRMFITTKGQKNGYNRTNNINSRGIVSGSDFDRNMVNIGYCNNTSVIETTV